MDVYIDIRFGPPHASLERRRIKNPPKEEVRQVSLGIEEDMMPKSGKHMEDSIEKKR